MRWPIPELVWVLAVAAFGWLLADLLCRLLLFAFGRAEFPHESPLYY